jgi:hypothetical protein
MVVSYRYMPMDLIGWLMMRPPILQSGLDLIILWVPLFLAEKPFIAFSGSLGEASEGFNLFDFIFCQQLVPYGPLAPSSHKVRYNPLLAWQTQCPKQCRGWMRGKKMKSDKYGGNAR